MNALTLIPGQLSLSQLRDVYSQPLNITLDESAFAAIDDSVACVNAILAEGRTAYGINTGFGLLAQTRISTEDLENLQRSLVLSHAAGIGEPLDDDLARLIMVLKINSLSRGFSGIRLSVIQALIGLVKRGRDAVDPGEPEDLAHQDGKQNRRQGVRGGNQRLQQMHNRLRQDHTGLRFDKQIQRMQGRDHHQHRDKDFKRTRNAGRHFFRQANRNVVLL